MKPIITIRRIAALASGLALLALATAETAQAAPGYRAICSGEYCFNVSNFAKSRSISGAGFYDQYYYITYGRLQPTHYNVRFRSANGGEVQIEVAPGEIRKLGVIPGRRYTISSQACVRQFLGRSQCTQWYTTTFTAGSR
jgi:hypothetical protein